MLRRTCNNTSFCIIITIVLKGWEFWQNNCDFWHNRAAYKCRKKSLSTNCWLLQIHEIEIADLILNQARCGSEGSLDSQIYRNDSSLNKQETQKPTKENQTEGKGNVSDIHSLSNEIGIGIDFAQKVRAKDYVNLVKDFFCAYLEFHVTKRLTKHLAVLD